MAKTILLTGATDGIGRATAELLASRGHHVLVHGRNPEKLRAVTEELSRDHPGCSIGSYAADLSDLPAVRRLAEQVVADHQQLDVIINNAGVFQTRQPITPAGLDVRFVVNTLAPYLLTERLLPRLGSNGRVVNLSSAAQAPVDLAALAGERTLESGPAYAQSKLAITMWSRALALQHPNGPVVVAVNPGSFLGSKMVKEAYGMEGGDLQIGAEILCRAALDDDFADASGKYFDNDSGRFAPPHPDGLDPQKCAALVSAVEAQLARHCDR